MNFNVKIIKGISVGYLLLPIFIFLLGWLKPIFAFSLVLTLAYSFYLFLLNEPKDILFFPKNKLIIIVLIILVWVGFSGILGIGFIHPDLFKVLSIQNDLVNQQTPIKYIYQGKTVYLSAYLGYFITVPVLFGKVVNYTMLNIISWLYTSLGVFLGIFYIFRFTKKFNISIIVFFILFSGFEILPYFLQNGGDTFKNIYTNFVTIEPFWSTILDFKMKLFARSNTHALYWSPQHILCCWIAMGLFINQWLIDKNTKTAPLYLMALVFWSPFILVGILPYFVYSAFSKNMIKYLSIGNLILIPVLFIIVWFVTSVPIAQYEKGLILYKAQRLSHIFYQFINYSIYYLTEFGIWGIFALFGFYKLGQNNFLKITLFVMIISFVFPLFKLGKWNDFGQWVIAPSLFLLFCLLMQIYNSVNKKFKIIFVVLISLSSWDALHFIGRSANIFTEFGFKGLKNKPKLNNLVDASVLNNWPIEQSLAPSDATFFRYISK